MGIGAFTSIAEDRGYTGKGGIKVGMGNRVEEMGLHYIRSAHTESAHTESYVSSDSEATSLFGVPQAPWTKRAFPIVIGTI